MELSNEFRVAAPMETVWAALTDIERIAPCMPGAELQSVEGDEYRGVVKVKVGPVTAQYKGVARFAERDDHAYRAVLEAQGRETRGQGNASATITAKLAPDGDGTTVSVVTDLMVSGRVAQFGRGVLADVSTKLLDRFAGCLADRLGIDDTAEADADEAGGGGVSSRARTEPVDLLGAAGAPVAKRLIPIGAVVAIALWLIGVVVRRRRR